MFLGIKLEDWKFFAGFCVFVFAVLLWLNRDLLSAVSTDCINGTSVVVEEEK